MVSHFEGGKWAEGRAVTREEGSGTSVPDGRVQGSKVGKKINTVNEK